MTPVAESGVEGSAIALNLGVTLNSESGDSPANSLASLVVSAIPVGATLSDGAGGHSFTATSGATSVDVSGWSYASLTITPATDQNFTLSVAATEKDAEGNLSTTTTSTEAVTVNPLAPTVTPVAESGVEGSAIALNLGVTLNSESGDSPANSLASLVVSAIPVGATLSDGAGGHSFTATSGATSVDVSGWSYASLTITPATDQNFTLSVAATEKDAEGNLSTTTTSTEAVTVNPLAPTVTPVAESGVEGSAIALNLGVTLNSESGDSPANSLASLVVSAIPVGATLSDGAGGHSFTATSGATSVDVSGWSYASLTITPATDQNFTLSVAATEKDAEGNLSTTTTSTEAVTVNPLAPTVTPVAESGVEGSAIALNLGVTLNSESGDSPANSLASLVVSAIPVGATLSDGAGGHSFTATSGATSVDVSGWSYASLTITPATDQNFTLSVAATEKDAEGNLSTTTTSTEAVTVNPLAPTVTPVAESGVEGSAIALNLGVTLNSESGDSPANSLASLVVSAIPVGATLSDGADGHSFTATSGATSVDVSGWSYASLTITPATDQNFTLSVAATEKDAEGNLSTTTTSTEAVTVSGTAPTGIGFALPSSFASIDSSGKLNGTNLGTFTETGGVVGDAFTYSGSSASGLSVSPAGVLSATSVSGSTSGTVIALPVKVTDITNGTQTTVTYDVVGGTDGVDTITVSGSSPTIVYGLQETTNDGGTDTINASGSTAPVWIVDGGNNLALGGNNAYSTLTAGSGGDVLVAGTSGNSKGTDTLISGVGSDSLTGSQSENTKFVYTYTSDSTQTSPDTINNFIAGTKADLIDVSAIIGATTFQTTQLASTSANVNANSVAWIQIGGNTLVFVNNTAAPVVANSAAMKIVLTGSQALVAANIALDPTAPAGIAGSPINLGLSDPSGDGALTTVTVSGMPAGWSLVGGTNNGDGFWTAQTNNVSALAVTTPTAFAGATLLDVNESWTNADGSAGTGFVPDNVEAYAPGAPIFALSGHDTLTGASANDEFVFAQPIGADTVYNFNAASDKVDLIGFSGVASFSDIQAGIANDANGDAVITLGSSETITLVGADAASLSASNFGFNQEPTTNNSGAMTISDGAMLPLGGTIDNTGTIALNSTGDETDLEVLVNSVTLQGGGQVTLSDNNENVIFGGASSATLTNVDNTISGAGQIGQGQMTLANEGTIDANGTNALTIDTGANVVSNSGALEATGSGGLVVNSAVANSGSLIAAGGDLTLKGDVTGAGTATISGGGDSGIWRSLVRYDDLRRRYRRTEAGSIRELCRRDFRLHDGRQPGPVRHRFRRQHDPRILGEQRRDGRHAHGQRWNAHREPQSARTIQRCRVCGCSRPERRRIDHLYRSDAELFAVPEFNQAASLNLAWDREVRGVGVSCWMRNTKFAPWTRACWR